MKTYPIVAVLLGVSMSVCALPGRASTVPFTPFSYPGAFGDYATGIDGNLIVGYYADASGFQQGYLYDGSTFKTISYAPGVDTTLTGISGNLITGIRQDAKGRSHGFIYNGTTFVDVDHPLAGSGSIVDPGGTYLAGISGTTVVGNYVDAAGKQRGFIFDGTTYTTFDKPGSGPERTQLFGISGDTLVGQYDDNGLRNFFMYTNGVFTDVPDDPSGDPVGSLYFAIGRSSSGQLRFAGANYGPIPGGTGQHALFFDGTNFVTITNGDPNQITTAYGVSGNKVVGTYFDLKAHISHSFVAVVPEPSALVMFAGGGMIALAVAARRLRAARR